MERDPEIFQSVEHGCKQSERRVAPSMPPGSYAGRLLAIFCDCSKSKPPVSKAQRAASKWLSSLSRKSALTLRQAVVQGSKDAPTAEDAPFGGFLLRPLSQAPTLPLPASLLLLQHAPSLAQERNYSPLEPEVCPYSPEYTFALFCLLPWNPTLVQETKFDNRNLEVEESCQEPVNMEPRKKVLLHAKSGAPLTVLFTQGCSGNSSRPCHPRVTGE